MHRVWNPSVRKPEATLRWHLGFRVFYMLGRLSSLAVRPCGASALLRKRRRAVPSSGTGPCRLLHHLYGGPRHFDQRCRPDSLYPGVRHLPLTNRTARPCDYTSDRRQRSPATSASRSYGPTARVGSSATGADREGPLTKPSACTYRVQTLAGCVPARRPRLREADVLSSAPPVATDSSVNYDPTRRRRRSRSRSASSCRFQPASSMRRSWAVRTTSVPRAHPRGRMLAATPPRSSPETLITTGGATQRFLPSSCHGTSGSRADLAPATFANGLFAPAGEHHTGSSRTAQRQYRGLQRHAASIGDRHQVARTLPFAS